MRATTKTIPLEIKIFGNMIALIAFGMTGISADINIFKLICAVGFMYSLVSLCQIAKKIDL
jgi:hypothetical protein